MTFDLFLFDLDGTLVDSLPDIAAALNGALEARGAAPLPVDVVRTLVGEGVLRLAEKAIALRPEAGDAAALARDVITRYEADPCGQTRLYPGMAETLVALRMAGRRLAVLTNKPGQVARALIAELRLSSTLDAVVGDGDGYARKPDPAAAHALLARFGVPPDRALMIGDGLPDVAMGKAAGITVAAASWGYTDRPRLAAERPDYVIAAPAQILDLA